ncbi:MAG: ThiF family adenylyltransferase, partial [Aigarchaeota archaeon]|nr:ThiF family adenylyltransferase [Candidatus Caldarchaeales archaeon]
MGEADALARYDRQLRLEGWDQNRLLSGRVIIAGVGALGCEVAKNLSLMGVGELLL